MRRARTSFLALLIALAVLYIGDYAHWRIHILEGDGMATVTVNQYLTTELKGSREEYDSMGTIDQPCSRSIFPHGGAPACWWLRRHTDHWIVPPTN